MTTVQPRTRSRVNAMRPTTKTRSPAASSTSSTHANGAGLSVLPVLFTNLRLLDLDTLPDWPDVSPDTFAATGVQGQKRRVHCIEWILVRLFELWDAGEASAKLKPFFPPADQLQSVNLRSALLRGLETAKKNGVLGRDTVIRRTMLDDCKGERLEELLTSFSTAVLKKTLEENIHASDTCPPVSVSLAFANRGYDDDNSDLNALILAYKFSLCRLLHRKSNARDLYNDFADLLSIKERAVARRSEAIRAKEADPKRDTLSNNAREEMRRLIRNNWSGNEDWMQTLVHGDFGDKETGLLAMPFDNVWRGLQQQCLAEIEENSIGLLDQLDKRVWAQRERLARWDMFRKETFGQSAQGVVSPKKLRAVEKKTNKGIDFKFSAHTELQVGSDIISMNMDVGRSPSLTPEYEGLVERLKQELSRIKDVDSTFLDHVHRRPSGQRFMGSFGHSSDAAETVSEISELEDEPYGPLPVSFPVSANRPKLESLGRHPVKPQMIHSEVFNQSTSTTGSISPPHEEPPQKRRIHLPPVEDFDEIEPPPSPTQTTADRILSSTDGASPSAATRIKQRPTLSLAQRTRLSMAGNHSPFLDEETALPLRPAFSDKHGPTPPSEPESKPADNEPMDLASRTRLSMAGFEKAQRKAQLERRKSLRKSKALPRKEGSYFPKLEEEQEEEGRAELTEELMLEEDMEAVFRSRPRIKASPLASPTREWDHE
ncbi:uncharacterized protein MAM_06041 [Metarhizium album ARSEF 1941]|uniref:HAUS augmin-like complex subunit 6 N-terminal domain-containing protein n=1 Tax=Metarhizium album (strain ARSEF 1941) TaxID=1081103 RepID=A0A0B2WQ92_METAS|nr:uncharacterized protein MAM_06041 [Metarhizium album ARSEF 1941]KHN96193.1 hypothetical protein MAM_06041 [Metarhizium album ARSEF 1941]